MALWLGELGELCLLREIVLLFLWSLAVCSCLLFVSALAIMWFWDVKEVGEGLNGLPLAEVGVPVLPSFASVSAASLSLAASAMGFSGDCDLCCWILQ